MTGKPTKSAQIMALHKQGKTTREIALKIYGAGCDVRVKMAYVRVVVNQRKGSGMSKHDKAYQAAEEAQTRRRAYQRGYNKRRYHSDPVWRQAKLDAVNAARAARIS